MRTITETAIDVTGRAAGVAIGLHVGGIEGAYLGTASSPIVTRTLHAGLMDFVERVLSQRARIETVFKYAERRSAERLDQGEQLRQDGFFGEDLGQKAAAEEITEGLLRTAQREREERKLPFLANLYASLAFSEQLDRGGANAVLQQAEKLSYRQLCLLALFTEKQTRFERVEGGEFRHLVYWQRLRQSPSTSYSALTALDEILEMERRSLVRIAQGVHPSIPSIVSVLRSGILLYELLELTRIEGTDVNALEALLQPVENHGDSP